MNTISKQTILIIFAIFTVLAFSLNAKADETYICLNAGVERTISVVYDIPGQVVPCEVTYDKGEGIESLWRANNEAGYCEAKAAEFVAKQQDWGWSCSRID